MRGAVKGHAVAAAALAAAYSAPAHAFITLHFSPWDWVLIALFFAWPVVLPLLLVALALLWGRRREWRVAYRSVLAVAVVGSALWSVPWIEDGLSSYRAAQESRYWDEVDQAAATGRPADAIKLLEARGAEGLQAYVYRFVNETPHAPDPVVLKAAFERCVDLLSGGMLETDLLERAIEAGQTTLIAAWLDAPECPRADGQTREARLVEIVYHLLPYTQAHDEREHAVHQERQAAGLRELMARHPALLQVDVSDFGCTRYKGLSPRCTVLGELFEDGHEAALRVLLPLDPNAGQHLPPVALHLLRGESQQAAEAARHDPDTFHRVLPALVATAPLEPLRALLRAVPPDEAALLTPKDDDTQFQHLWPLFEPARRRDAGAPEWAFLSLLFELFPKRLAEVDPDLFDGYLIGTEARDARVLRMLATLRQAQMPCEKLQRLVGWGDDTPAARAWYGEVTECEMPAR
nr:hypothetical protein [uncultured Caldimonas sp.]